MKVKKMSMKMSTVLLGAMVSVHSITASAGPWEQATGPSAGTISKNVANSLFGIANGFEAFLYMLGIVFVVLFILAAWKYKKSDGRDGSMGLISTYLVLAVASMAAPTVLGSGMSTIFGGSTVTRVPAPSAQQSTTP